MNVTKALDKVTDWQQAASQLKQQLPQGDRVLAHWYRLLSDFKQDLPLLKKLSSNALKVWNALTEFSGYPKKMRARRFDPSRTSIKGRRAFLPLIEVLLGSKRQARIFWDVYILVILVSTCTSSLQHFDIFL